ncbi:hypothetical protein C8R46DRAFT_1142156 [Mycena filopes]|nr:hypothetical protein C8R46DRAFT_1142156 [Mycena filopes]
MALDRCFRLLEDLVCEADNRRFSSLSEALHAGLLCALVSVGSMTCAGGGNISAHVQHWLRRVLPPTMVYYHVVAATVGNCPTITVGSKNTFIHSSVYPDWLALLGVITSRISTLEAFQSPEYLSLKFCDNHTKPCRNVKRLSEIKCCSGCCGVYYCSSECQRVAWNDGHRELCMSVQESVQSFRDHFGSKRDEAFMHHIVLQDYKACKTAVLRAQVLCARANPALRQLCTVFDYSKDGECRISVVAPQDAPCSPSAMEANSATSIHYVVISTAAEWKTSLIYPLRSSNTILEQGVFRIAKQEGLEGSALTRELKDLSRTPVVEAYA